MKIETTVDWNAPRPHNRQTTAEPLEPPRSRTDRRLWCIAVSRHIDRYFPDSCSTQGSL